MILVGPPCEDDLAGCSIVEHALALFRSRATTSTMFFRDLRENLPDFFLTPSASAPHFDAG